MSSIPWHVKWFYLSRRFMRVSLFGRSFVIAHASEALFSVRHFGKRLGNWYFAIRRESK